MSKNYYPEMLELLFELSEKDQPKIFRWICRNRPKSIIDAINAINNPVEQKEKEPAHYAVCRDFVKQDKKINAIKHWREATGDGLKEAKEKVESIFY
jgi:hypothetical protein